MMARVALVVATIDKRAVDQYLLRLRPSVPEPSPATALTGRVRGSDPSTIPTAPAGPSTPGRSHSGARLRRRGWGRNTYGLAVFLALLPPLPPLPAVAVCLGSPGAPRLDEQKPRNRRLWRRRARAFEPVAGRPVAQPLPLGVLSCPEPAGAPRGGTGAELGHCQRRRLTVLSRELAVEFLCRVIAEAQQAALLGPRAHLRPL